MSLSCLDYLLTCRQFFLIKWNTINVLQLPAVIHKHLGHLRKRFILLSIALQPGTKGLNLCKHRVENGAILSRCSDIFSQVWGEKKDSVHRKPGRKVLEKLTVTYLLNKFPASCDTEILHRVHKSMAVDPNLNQLFHILPVFKTHSNTLHTHPVLV